MSEDVFRKIEWARVRTFEVGGIPVVFGRAASSAANGPQIFGAALSEEDLRREQCGYGATEAEAAADLFRLMRPSIGSIF